MSCQNVLKTVVFICLLALIGQYPAFAQSLQFKARWIIASDYGKWYLESSSVIASGAQTISIFMPATPLTSIDGVAIEPIRVSRRLMINDGVATEAITTTSVNCPGDGTVCNVTATFSNQHGSNGKFRVQSGTAGVQEAIDSLTTPGFVHITPDFTGTTANFTTDPAGKTSIIIKDVRGLEAWYTWNGSAYVISASISSSGGFSSNTSTFITQTVAAGLPNAQALSTLATGVLSSTTGTGVLSSSTFLNLTALNNIQKCDQMAGATADAKIIACIAALPSTGGVADARGIIGAQTISSNFYNGTTKPVLILVCAATFTVTTAISPTSNSYLKGCGKGVTIFRKGANVDVIANQHISNVELSDFTVDGNKASFTQNDISMQFMSNFSIHDLELENANLKGFACASCYGGNIYNNYGHNNGQDTIETGVQASAFYAISGVTNANPTVIAIGTCSACSPINIGDSVMIKGVVGTTAVNGGPYGVINVSGSNITIQVVGNGAYVSGGTLTSELDNSWNIDIHDNRASSDGVYSFACIQPTDNREPSPHNIRYANNYAEMNGVYGFESKGCHLISWKNNHSFNNIIHGFNVGTPGSGNVNFVDDSDTLEGNVSYNNGGDGIFAQATNSTFTGNVLTDNRGAPFQKYGLQFNVDGGNVVTGNIAIGNTTAGFCTPGVTSNQFGVNNGSLLIPCS